MFPITFTFPATKASFRRALNSLFLSSHSSIAEFVLRMLNNNIINNPLLTSSEKESWTDILKEQFKLEFAYVVYMGRRDFEERFVLEREWSEVKELVERYERKTPTLRLWCGDFAGAWERFVGAELVGDDVVRGSAVWLGRGWGGVE